MVATLVLHTPVLAGKGYACQHSVNNVTYVGAAMLAAWGVFTHGQAQAAWAANGTGGHATQWAAQVNKVTAGVWGCVSGTCNGQAAMVCTAWAATTCNGQECGVCAACQQAAVMALAAAYPTSVLAAAVAAMPAVPHTTTTGAQRPTTQRPVAATPAVTTTTAATPAVTTQAGYVVAASGLLLPTVAAHHRPRPATPAVAAQAATQQAATPATTPQAAQAATQPQAATTAAHSGTQAATTTGRKRHTTGGHAVPPTTLRCPVCNAAPAVNGGPCAMCR